MSKPEQELADIKAMMERSTRFLSLSGLAGVMAGSYALVATGLAYYWIYYPHAPFGPQISYINEQSILIKLLTTAFIILVAAIGTGWVLSQNKSKRTATKFWTPASKRFTRALFIPVATGGLFCLALMSKGYMELVAPATLIFYGLGLFNSSHFTLSDIKYLGYCQLTLGVIAAFFPEWGLVLWALGFGILHIVYGTMMHFKYDR